MSHLFANNATSRLKIITPAGSTTLTVLDEDAERFPSPVAPDIFLVTLDDRRTGQIEICACTARTGNILTVLRGQEGTVAQDFAEWATVSNRATAGTFQYLLDVVLNAAGWGKQEADDRFVNVTGDTMLDALKGVTPLAPEDLTRKDYVDAQDATKASLVHTHPISDVVDLQAELDTKLEPAPADGADYVQYNGNWTVLNWTTLDGKPLTMPPAPHTHPMSEVVDLESTLGAMNAEIDTKVGPEARADGIIYGRKNGAWADVTTGLNWGQIPGQPDTFPPSAHQHAIADVINLQATLNSKEPVITAGDPASFWAGDKTWKTIQQTAAAASIGDSPPVSPVPGQMWWESDSGFLFIRYQDVNSQQWVQVNNPGLTDAPADGEYYARRDGSWRTFAEATGAIPEAPADGQLYSRKGSTKTWEVAASGGGGMDQATADARYVNVSGDVMTGVLGLPNQLTVGAPATNSIHFGTAGTGLTGATNAVSIGTAGTTRLTVGNTDSQFFNRIYATAGAVGAAAIHFGTSSTGFYSSGGTDVRVTIGGALKYTFGATQNLSAQPIVLPASTTSLASLNIPHGVDPSVPVNGDIWTTTTQVRARMNGTVRVLAMTSVDNSFTFQQTFKVPSTGSPSINLPHGVAPTSLANGDMWTTTAGLFLRVNGATVGPLGAGSPAGGATTQVQFNNAGAFGGDTGLTYDVGAQTLGLYNTAEDWKIGLKSADYSLSVMDLSFGGYASIYASGVTAKADSPSFSMETEGTNHGQLIWSRAFKTAWSMRPWAGTEDLSFVRHDAFDGAVQDIPMRIEKSTGLVHFNFMPQMGGQPLVPASIGNVFGPGSGTADNQLARWNGTSHTAIQGSTFTLNDDGQFTIKSGANNILEYGTAGTASAGGFAIRAMPPHGQQIVFIPRSDTDGAPHIIGGITFDDPITMKGVTTLSGTCSSNLHAVHKAYVDNNFAGQAWVTSQDALLVAKAGSTMTGKLDLPAATTAAASLTIPHGVAPTTPVNGEVWSTTLGIYVRVNGVTVGPLVDKAYVDAKSSSVFVSDNPPSTIIDGMLWWRSTDGVMFIRFNDGSSSQWVEA